MPHDSYSFAGGFYDLMYMDPKLLLPPDLRKILDDIKNFIIHQTNAEEIEKYCLNLDFPKLILRLQEFQPLFSDSFIAVKQAALLLEHSKHLDAQTRMELLGGIYPLFQNKTVTLRLLTIYLGGEHEDIGRAVYNLLVQEEALKIPSGLLKILAECYKEAVFNTIKGLDRDARCVAYDTILNKPESALYQLFHRQRGLRSVSESRGLLGEVKEAYDYLTSWRGHLDALNADLQAVVDNVRQKNHCTENSLLHRLDAEISNIEIAIREISRHGATTGISDLNEKMVALVKARLCCIGELTHAQLHTALAKNTYFIAAINHRTADHVTSLLAEAMYAAKPVMGIAADQGVRDVVVGVPVQVKEAAELPPPSYEEATMSSKKVTEVKVEQPVVAPPAAPSASCLQSRTTSDVRSRAHHQNRFSLFADHALRTLRNLHVPSHRIEANNQQEEGPTSSRQKQLT